MNNKTKDNNQNLTKMKTSKHFKTLAIIAAVGIIGAVSVVLYMVNMPQRNVQSAKVDYSVNSTQIVSEYLSDNQASNTKYLSEDGDSKILEVSGIISKISEDYNGLKVVLLKDADADAGVSCSFTTETSSQTADLKVGDIVVIKGVIRSGASYDEDLELYENVILEKCSVVTKYSINHN
jgi:hypothetical protein